MELSDFLEEWNDSSPTVTVHTSGSTGTPKEMCAEKSRMLASARITCDFLGLKSGDNALLCLPMEYIAGKMMAVRSLERGMNLLSVRPDQHPFAALPDDGKVISLAAMVPSQVFCTLKSPHEKERMMAVRNLIIGGGSISSEICEALSGFPYAVWSTYGMTETLSHIALRRLNGPQRSGWYTPFEGVDIRTADDGCLVIDAPAVHDGVLKTNDIADMHPDGRRFRIIGRKDNVICSGGIKLQIESIEEQMGRWLKVPFCITKLPDAKFGEVAVLLIEKGTCPPIEAGIASMDSISRPKKIISVEKIPMTPNGKTDRAAAASLAAAGADM